MQELRLRPAFHSHEYSSCPPTPLSGDVSSRSSTVGNSTYRKQGSRCRASSQKYTVEELWNPGQHPETVEVWLASVFSLVRFISASRLGPRMAN